MTVRSIISQVDERALPLFPPEETENLCRDARGENRREPARTKVSHVCARTASAASCSARAPRKTHQGLTVRLGPGGATSEEGLDLDAAALKVD